MKIGRNDPCPCGSGKKYKHCCLLKEQAAAAPPEELARRRLRQALDGVPAKLLRFVTRAYGAATLDEAWQAFTNWRDEHYDPESLHAPLFLPWLFHRWAPNPDDTEVTNASLHGVPPTRAYLDRERHVPDRVRRYLEACLASPFRFYEVDARDGPNGLRVHDLTSDTRHVVLDHLAAAALAPGSLFFGQLAGADGVTLLEATSPIAFVPDDKPAILERCRNIRAQLAADGHSTTPIDPAEAGDVWDAELRDLYWQLAKGHLDRSLPEIRTRDGAAMELHTLIFDIDSPEATYAALKSLDPDAGATPEPAEKTGSLYHLNWAEAGGDPAAGRPMLGQLDIGPDRLEAFVLSRERAERFRVLMRDRLPTGAQFRLDKIMTPQQLLDGAPPSFETETPADRDDPVVRAAVVEQISRYYQHWIDTPLPALGGMTPAAAAADPARREQLQALLHGLADPNRALPDDVFAGIVRELREQLKLGPAVAPAWPVSG